MIKTRNNSSLRCPKCGSTRLVYAGKAVAGGYKVKQRYRCKNCGVYTVNPKGG